MNTPADARAEDAMRAQGITPDETTTAPEDSPLEIARLIDADASLFHRPQVRRLIRYLATHPLTNLDGSPVVDKSGKPLPGTAWDAIVRSEILRMVNGDEKAREFVLHTIFGKPREAMEFSGPAGGPIETSSRLDSLSAEEMAARLVRATRIARGVLEREQSPPPSEAIEVTATTTSEGAPVAAIAPIVVDTSVLPPGVSPIGARPLSHPQIAPAAAPPQVGMIARR
jgi:hypothetical protein